MKWFKTALAVCRDNPVIVWVGGFCIVAFVMVVLALLSTMM